LVLCIELTSAVIFSLSFGVLFDGIWAIDWRDFGLLGLVVCVSIPYELKTSSRFSFWVQPLICSNLDRAARLRLDFKKPIDFASQEAWRKQRREL
jgi:hypothetical protein